MPETQYKEKIFLNNKNIKFNRFYTYNDQIRNKFIFVKKISYKRIFLKKKKKKFLLKI